MDALKNVLKKVNAIGSVWDLILLSTLFIIPVNLKSKLNESSLPFQRKFFLELKKFTQIWIQVDLVSKINWHIKYYIILSTLQDLVSWPIKLFRLTFKTFWNMVSSDVIRDDCNNCYTGVKSCTDFDKPFVTFILGGSTNQTDALLTSIEVYVEGKGPYTEVIQVKKFIKFANIARSVFKFLKNFSRISLRISHQDGCLRRWLETMPLFVEQIRNFRQSVTKWRFLLTSIKVILHFKIIKF